MAGHGLRQTSSPTSPGPASRPVGSVHGDVHPERRTAERARLQRADRVRRQEAGADLGAAGQVDDRQPRPCRPPRRTSGTARGSTARRSRRGSAATRGRGDRTGSSPAGISARIERGRDAEVRDRGVARPSTRAGRARDGSGAPSYRKTVAPSAVAPTTSHGPMIQPRSANQNRSSPRLDVGLVRDLLRDLDEEPAVDVHRALRPSRRAARVRDEQRVLGIEAARSRTGPRASSSRSLPQRRRERRPTARRRGRGARRRSRAARSARRPTASSATSFIADARGRAAGSRRP